MTVLSRPRNLVAGAAVLVASFSVLSARRAAQVASREAGGKIVRPERSGGGI
ncbi:uncharacterized protein PFL1_01028 [Pseudozyma flocculosa PF-1]|uniref:Uncharacterized protein n=1 Tax=Pseudozyma flocculosa TaxID=84751 RepID=A0A5C3F8T5_9BASI|nr:uncharacterized protein PFL1_01028 [Pseudozyma flocculosa PF-1]EPQ31695.1 hypothetical protein PFL1_01028 [Pseudozyma flocculosa PF-1]SPO40812.1 uncharacterized protein PSFLO_06294 [Pseudozyma flocculosa]